MAAYRRVDDLVSCGLTACTPGSAPNPTLDNEYGKRICMSICPLEYLKNMLLVALARYFSDDNAISYVLPVLLMTSSFQITVHVHSGSVAEVIDEQPVTLVSSLFRYVTSHAGRLSLSSFRGR